MDRYLSLKDADEYSDELELISESLEELIDIFYRALDADKTGEELCLHRHTFAWMSVCILPSLSLSLLLLGSLITVHEVSSSQ